jgi:3alpha(or 20beta)-hydroxysteroid dehydrogenase
MSRLAGKVALITGAAQGQGAAEARAFAAEGATVVLADVADDAGRAVATELGEPALFVHLDVSDAASWTSAVAMITGRFGRLDILINNAARYWTRPLAEETAATLDAMVAVNLRGPMLGIQHAAPAMAANGGGSIVNVSSTAGLSGYPGHGAYGMTKWALRGLSKTAAVEFAPQGIRVNTLIPGAVEGPMLFSNVPADVLADPAHWVDTPLGRAARPAEIAAAAVFLACDDSSYMTGTELVIDGGSTGTG